MTELPDIAVMRLWSYLLTGGPGRHSAIRQLYVLGVWPEEIAAKGLVPLDFVQEALAYKDLT